ncbi:HD-GYP domain-containing protein [Amphritea pacifica]|uniref:HD domain-containing protein n=1 Tax=Amphritea pacifica TaxID=2811233 RepID=A0ABS2WBG2_9GAMM|nr:HD domain-containing phosphohydrolase [Amphritea pacifica]MBN0988961.1 HD domain-containing protein [Amphritea pacifica]
MGNIADELVQVTQGMKVDVGHAALTVTKALDYVGIDDKSHGRRVGLICHRIAHLLGWNRTRRHFILIAGMLHDCGVSSTTVHRKLVAEIEWEGAEEHCLRGDQFLQSFPPFCPFAAAIRYHHTRWQDLPPSLDNKTREYANLIFFADRLDVAYASFVIGHPHHEVLLGREHLLAELAPYVGILFSDEIYTAAAHAIQKDSFWLELREEYLDDAILEALSSEDYEISLSFDEIESLGELISQIVDAKSPYTHYHSLRVADLAYTLSGLAGLGPYQRRILRLSGLLHDVGKLRTPDEILEKPGALTDAEVAQMRSHPLDSKRVLNSLFPNTPIAKWAAEHHEKLDGSCYPFGWKGDQIDFPTRILSVADIFQALCQKRPYRHRLNIDDVLEIMDVMAAKGEIDLSIYGLLKANKEELYTIAIRT